MSNNDEHINLKVNGRLYPTATLTNYGKYALPKMEVPEGVDTCNEEKVKSKLELKNYQQFIVNFLSSENNNEALLYYGVGSGKSAIIISLYNELFNRSPNINIFFLIKASHENHPWRREIKIWLAKADYEERMKHIHFIHYDSPFADTDFFNEVKKSDITYKNIFIIDESHNFISNVYSNVTTHKGKRALAIYEYLINEKKQTPNTKLLLLSATPAVNNPFEFALTFNLLRENAFPKNESLFNQYYIDVTNGISHLKRDMKNTLQRRIIGLVSYYIGAEASPSEFASSTIHNINVKMSAYQTEIYNYYEEIERRMALQQQQSTGKSRSYGGYTRQCVNFAYPFIDDKFNGESRPRPSKYKVNERELEKLFQSKDYDKVKATMQKEGNQQYAHAIARFEQRLEEYFDSLYQADKRTSRTIENDLANFARYETAQEYIEADNDKSTLMQKMIDCSTKFVSIMFYISKTELPILIYSNNVIMEGINIIKLYLKYFNYRSFKDEKATDFHRYGEFHGLIPKPIRAEAIEMENMPENRYGKWIKIMLFSQAGAEGISLSNIGQVHITEPYWHENRIVQMIGRALRLCSHKNLPMNERHVDIYRYKSVKDNVLIKRTIEDQEEKVERIVITDERKLRTIDFNVEDVAKEKASLMETFYDAIREVAIDCEIFKNHNMINTKYRCFKFNEISLFDKNVGPAYKDDIVEDQKISNGLNSVDSVILKVKVLKITGIVTVGEKEKESFYWYRPETGHIYDYDLHFVVGKIKYDDCGMPIKTGKNVYHVELIHVPLVKDVKKRK
jgi:superfamily II DNA or RNA helicase